MLSFESPVKTPWHDYPAGLKLLVLCVATLCLFLLDSLVWQLAAFFVCVGMYLLCGSSFAATGLKRLFFLWPFLCVIVIWHWFSGTPIQGAIAACRLITLIALSNLVTMTSKLSDLIDVLHVVLAPLRKLGLSTRPIEIAIALVVRFTPELVRKGGAIMDAWRARSTKRPAWRIVLPLTLAAIDDAEQVAEALKARGGVAY